MANKKITDQAQGMVVTVPPGVGKNYDYGGSVSHSVAQLIHFVRNHIAKGFTINSTARDKQYWWFQLNLHVILIFLFR